MYAGAAFTFVTLLFVEMVLDKHDAFTGTEWTMLLVSPLIGVILTRVVVLWLVKPSKVGCLRGVAAVSLIWTSRGFERMMKEKEQ